MKDTKHQEFVEDQYEEIDILELLRKLGRSWKTVLLWVVIAAVAGIIVGFSIPKEYTVKVKMAPEIAQRSSGSLSSLASLAGINMNNIIATDAMYPDLYPEIVASTPFIVDLFDLPVDFTFKKDSGHTDLYDYFQNYTRQPWWNAVLQLPFRAIGALRSHSEEDSPAVTDSSTVDPEHLTRKQAIIAKMISKNLGVAVDKKNYIIQVTATAQDPQVAWKMGKTVTENLQKYVANYRTEKARHDLLYYQELYDEARAKYFSAQQKYASYVDANQGLVFQRVRTEQERLQNEANLAYQIYNQTAQQLQLAKAKVQQDTPVVALIQPASVPTKPSKPSKMTILVAFMFIGFCLGAVIVLTKKPKEGKKEEEEIAELEPEEGEQ